MNSSISNSDPERSAPSADRQYWRYLIVWAIATGLVLGSIFVANALIDPLWHFSGNRLDGVNFAFNEREMKLNALVRDVESYDCLILGSSRATLLDARQIAGNRCFNLAFSNGNLSEFLIPARYLKKAGVRPRKLILSFNEVSFIDIYDRGGRQLPDYVVSDGAPSWAIEDYFTLDALSLSYRTIQGQSPLPRAYARTPDGEMEGFILPGTKALQPRRVLTAHPRSREPYRRENLDKLRELIAVFPDTEWLGYVAPISDWAQAKIQLTGNLENWIAIRHAAAGLFNGGLIDFSIPGPITRRTKITYDGLHYTF